MEGCSVEVLVHMHGYTYTVGLCVLCTRGVLEMTNWPPEEVGCYL